MGGLNAYFCTFFWALTGENVFRGRNGPVPLPLLDSLGVAFAGPMFGVLISIFIGPLYVWMLESIVQRFETRAKPGKILHGEVEISS
jgi:hypothetical protein